MISKTEKDRSEIFFKVTVPLYQSTPKKPVLVGSGILFETNGKVFLITAKHVIKEWGKYLYIPTEPTTQFSPGGNLFSILLKNTISGSIEDSIDAAIIEINNPDELRHYYQITNASSFQLETRKGEQYQYAIAGYPCSKAKVNPIYRTATANLCVYYTQASELTAYDGIRYWKETHIAVNFQKETIYSNTGAIATAPSFNGVSGGGLWIIKVADEPNDETYKIYGINIEADIGKSVFYATRIKLIFDFIARQYNFKNL